MEKRTGITVQVVVYRQKPGDGKEILVLGLRKAAEPKSWWQSAKGSAEQGEGLEDAALRETPEETGLSAPLRFIDLDYSHTFVLPERYRPLFGEGIKSVRKYSFAFQTDREEVTLSEEHVGYRWFASEEALRKFRFKGARDAVRKPLEILDKENPG